MMKNQSGKSVLAKQDEAAKLFELAIEHANTAAEQAPNVAAYHLKLATFYDRRKQLKAIRFYDKAIELDPYNAEAYYRRGLFMSNYTFGEARVLLYDPKDVMDDLQKAIQLDPNLAGAHYALGVAYDRMGNVQKAMVEFRESRKSRSLAMQGLISILAKNMPIPENSTWR